MVGTELALNAMDWNGKDTWLDAPRGLWKVNDYPAGWAKEHKNLTFVVVYNSGHMVPYNAPTSAYDLLTRLLTHQSFIDTETAQIRIPAEPGTQDKSKILYDTLVQELPESSSSSLNSQTNPNNNNNNNSNHPLRPTMDMKPMHRQTHIASVATPVVFALLAGIILGAIFARKGRFHNDKKANGYRSVPDADED
jgi:hypothetical protein